MPRSQRCERNRGSDGTVSQAKPGSIASLTLCGLPGSRNLNNMSDNSLQTLIDRSAAQGQAPLPEKLHELYDGDLYWPAAGPNELPYVIANFVASLDGVVSYKLPQRSGGAAISGSDPIDRFIMGLLRASADAVMVGAGTLHDASPDTLWTAGQICPDAARLYEDYRRALDKPEPPLTVIVSASGLVDLRRAAFQTPGSRVLIVTTDAGRGRLGNAGIDTRSSVEVRVLDAHNGRIDPIAILGHLRSSGVRLLLHEGGPTLFGDSLSAGAVNELFLTLAPQAIGRVQQTRRPGLVEGLEFLPEGAPWFSLISLKCHAEQLYLRYRCTGPRQAPEPIVETRDKPSRA